ncbi:MAG: Lnb N-terminal periplasmic domain-containing protein [Gallionella sp.]
MRLFIGLIIFCCATPFGQAQAGQSYVQELMLQAQQLKLSERIEWHKLLHYLPQHAGVLGALDSPGFYLAADGKVNPQQELFATLLSFAAEREETATQQHPQCAFIARYNWLNEQLHFDAERLIPHRCARFQAWRDTLNPRGLTLVFASAYLNSPSSMYGHTLLRVDAADQDEHTRLLAYSISFAANTKETNGLAFAINGLFGGYPGTYSILPYYAKVREYSDFENRDIWEYPLDLSPLEVERVLMHAWELGPHYYQYYFFDENCAYQLLSLLQVARPTLQLTAQFPHWAIPADTVREIAAYPSLIKNAVYRPANATALRSRLAKMSAQERALVLALGAGKLPVSEVNRLGLADERAAAILETSLDWLSYRRISANSQVAQPEPLASGLRLARSQLNVAAQAMVAPAALMRPEQGHASARLDAGIGQRDNSVFQELQIRPTYHDLMDSDAGYVRGAEINFFSLTLRHYNAQPLRVEKLMPVNITSLAPRDEFFHAPSWRVEVGWQRVATRRSSEPLALSLQGGAGGAWSNTANDVLSYAFLNSGLRLAAGLERGYALGLGPEVGVYVDALPRWRLHGYAQMQQYVLGQTDTATAVGIEQRVALTQNTALRFDVMAQRELQLMRRTFNSRFLWYF